MKEGVYSDLGQLKGKMNSLRNRPGKKATAPASTDDARFLRVHWSQLYAEKQVRIKFKDIEEMGKSLKRYGQDNPITVAPADADGKYRIIRGERRWQGAQLMDLDVDIQIDDRSLSEREKELSQIVENIHRSPLHPLELAYAYQRLKDGGMTQDDIAAETFKSKTDISKTLKLLNLPEEVQQLLLDEKIVDKDKAILLGELAGVDRKSFKKFCDQLAADAPVSRGDIQKALQQGKQEKKELPKYNTPDRFRTRSGSAVKLQAMANIKGEVVEGTPRFDLDSGDEKSVVIESGSLFVVVPIAALRISKIVER